MASLRLFANLREAAGTSTATVAGATVAEVLEKASADFGDAFAAGLAHAKVWVNGEPAETDTPVADSDEVALIPPVSGGALATESPLTARFMISAALLTALLLASLTSVQMLTIAVVAVSALWIWDLAGNANQSGLAVNVFPLFAASVACAWGAYRWGFDGFGFGVITSVVVVLVLALFQPRYRSVEALAATGLVSLAAGIGAGALVLTRGFGADELSAYIAVVVAALGASWLVGRYHDALPFLDPTMAAPGGAVAAGAVAGAFMESWSVIFVASVATAAALVAGRTVGSLVRSGDVYLVDTAPGFLAFLDGPMTAAGVFWLAIELFN